MESGEESVEFPTGLRSRFLLRLCKDRRERFGSGLFSSWILPFLKGEEGRGVEGHSILIGEGSY